MFLDVPRYHTQEIGFKAASSSVFEKELQCLNANLSWGCQLCIHKYVNIFFLLNPSKHNTNEICIFTFNGALKHVNILFI
jgi:hypothetical protein